MDQMKQFIDNQPGQDPITMMQSQLDVNNQLQQQIYQAQQ